MGALSRQSQSRSIVVDTDKPEWFIAGESPIGRGLVSHTMIVLENPSRTSSKGIVYVPFCSGLEAVDRSSTTSLAVPARISASSPEVSKEVYRAGKRC
jgi:hypothetical protein